VANGKEDANDRMIKPETAADYIVAQIVMTGIEVTAHSGGMDVKERSTLTSMADSATPSYPLLARADAKTLLWT
jgi:hypothetical protein